MPVVVVSFCGVFFLIVDTPTAFFLSPCACHGGSVAQALVLNGARFEFQIIRLLSPWAGYLSLRTSSVKRRVEGAGYDQPHRAVVKFKR